RQATRGAGAALLRRPQRDPDRADPWGEQRHGQEPGPRRAEAHAGADPGGGRGAGRIGGDSMSDDEIRDLLDRGVQDPDASEELTAEQLWSAGRRRRTRGRAWIGGLGAAAAAASILGVVWAQGLA